MPTQLQIRRGSSAENDAFTGASGELTFDTTNNRVRVHDGATQGGYELKTETSGGDTLFADNEKAIFGAGNDLQIYHDGSSYIKDVGGGNLSIMSDGAGILMEKTDGENIAFFDTVNSNVELFEGGIKRLETTSTGISVTGNATFADNGKAIFGAGNDLSVYHDGTRSHIEEDGLGGLWISTNGTEIKLRQGGSVDEEMLVATPNGSVDLYYNNNLKLATTSTGVDITGTITSDGLTVDGQGTFTTSDNSAQVTLISTDTDALVGPQLNLWRNSGTGTNGDLIGQITFTGEDSIGSATTFGTVYGVADQTNNGAEDGSLHFQTLINGVLADRLEINSAGNTVVTGTITSDGLTVSGVVKAPDGSNAAPAYTNSGDADGGMYFPAANQVSFASGGLQRLNIGSDGDISFYENTGTTAKFFWDASAESLGIGTSSPYTLLELSSIDPILRFNDSNGGTDTKNFELRYVGTNSPDIDGLYFRTVNDANTVYSDKMAILGSGNVGIGTSSPSARLHVKENANLNGGNPHFQIEGAGYSAFHWLDATAYYIGQNSTLRQVRIYSGAETAGVALTNGSTSWGTFSDERLKYDVENIENAVETLSGIRTVKYRLNNVDAPDAKKKLGVIAQDLEGVLDEVVDTTMLNEDDTEYMSVRYTELIPVLIKAIQEQQATITALEERITALENA